MSSRPIKGIHSINVDRGFGPDGRRVKSPSDGLSLQVASDKRRSPTHHHKRSPANSRTPSPNLEKQFGRSSGGRAKTASDIYHASIKSPRSAFQAPGEGSSSKNKSGGAKAWRASPVGAKAAGAGGRERKSPSPYSSSSRKSPSAGLGGDEKKKALGAKERKERDRAAAAAAAASAAIVEEELKHDDDDDDEPESDVDDVELQSITAGLNQGALGPRPQNGASHVPSRLPSHLAGDEKKEAAEKKAPKDKTDPPRPRSAPGSRGHGADRGREIGRAHV